MLHSDIVYTSVVFLRAGLPSLRACSLFTKEPVPAWIYFVFEAA